mgnify:CR=1 FL=1
MRLYFGGCEIYKDSKLVKKFKEGFMPSVFEDGAGFFHAFLNKIGHYLRQRTGLRFLALCNDEFRRWLVDGGYYFWHSTIYLTDKEGYERFHRETDGGLLASRKDYERYAKERFIVKAWAKVSMPEPVYVDELIEGFMKKEDLSRFKEFLKSLEGKGFSDLRLFLLDDKALAVFVKNGAGYVKVLTPDLQTAYKSFFNVVRAFEGNEALPDKCYLPEGFIFHTKPITSDDLILEGRFEDLQFSAYGNADLVDRLIYHMAQACWAILKEKQNLTEGVA